MLCKLDQSIRQLCNIELGSVKLFFAAFTQQRLDKLEVSGDLLTLVWGFAKGVVLPRGDPLEYHLERGGKQHHIVKLRVETALVGLAA